MCYDDTEQLMLVNETNLAFTLLKEMLSDNDPDAPDQMIRVKNLLERLTSWGYKTLIEDEFNLIYKNYLIEKEKNHG